MPRPPHRNCIRCARWQKCSAARSGQSATGSRPVTCSAAGLARRTRAARFNIGVTPDIDLSKLTMAEKDALILSLLPLVGQLEAALARIAELEARWHCWRSRPRRRTTRRRQRRRTRRPPNHLTTASRNARAVPASAARWSPIPTASSIRGSMPARVAPPPARQAGHPRLRWLK